MIYLLQLVAYIKMVPFDLSVFPFEVSCDKAKKGRKQCANANVLPPSEAV